MELGDLVGVVDVDGDRLDLVQIVRLTREGVLVLKAQQSRSPEQNKEDALQRLQALIDAAAVVQAVRRATKPTRGSQRRRLDEKNAQRAGQGVARQGKRIEGPSHFFDALFPDESNALPYRRPGLV